MKLSIVQEFEKFFEDNDNTVTRKQLSDFMLNNFNRRYSGILRYFEHEIYFVNENEKPDPGDSIRLLNKIQSYCSKKGYYTRKEKHDKK